MTHDDRQRSKPDAPFLPAGPGLAITWQCMGCGQKRGTSIGARGVGVRKRCAQCVERKKQ